VYKKIILAKAFLCFLFTLSGNIKEKKRKRKREREREKEKEKEKTTLVPFFPQKYLKK